MLELGKSVALVKGAALEEFVLFTKKAKPFVKQNF